jgi:hypothetical protein
VPADDRLGLDDRQRLPPSLPEPEQEDPEEPIASVKPRLLGSPLQHIELVAKGEVLGHQAAPRPQNGDQGLEDDVEHEFEPIGALR